METVVLLTAFGLDALLVWWLVCRIDRWIEKRAGEEEQGALLGDLHRPSRYLCGRTVFRAR